MAVVGFEPGLDSSIFTVLGGIYTQGGETEFFFQLRPEFFGEVGHRLKIKGMLLP
jgi:hypothetical protein